jgi:hypothetical protein
MFLRSKPLLLRSKLMLFRSKTSFWEVSQCFKK